MFKIRKTVSITPMVMIIEVKPHLVSTYMTKFHTLLTHGLEVMLEICQLRCKTAKIRKVVYKTYNYEKWGLSTTIERTLMAQFHILLMNDLDIITRKLLNTF